MTDQCYRSISAMNLIQDTCLKLFYDKPFDNRELYTYLSDTDAVLDSNKEIAEKTVLWAQEILGAAGFDKKMPTTARAMTRLCESFPHKDLHGSHALSFWWDFLFLLAGVVQYNYQGVAKRTKFCFPDGSAVVVDSIGQEGDPITYWEEI